MGRKRKYPKHKQTKPKWHQREDEWGNFVFDWTLGLGTDTWREIFSIAIIIFSILTLLGLVGSAGSFGVSLADFMRNLVGKIPAFIVPFIIFWFGLVTLLPERFGGQKISKIIGFFLLIGFFSAFFQLFVPFEDAATLKANGGGSIGYLFSNPLRSSLGLFSAFLIIISMIVISFMMTFNISLKKILLGAEESDRGDKQSGHKLDNLKVNKGISTESEPKKAGFFSRFRGKNKKPTLEEEPARAPVLETSRKLPSVQREHKWIYPSLDILNTSESNEDPGDIKKNVEIIKNTLQTFGIEVEVGEVNIGPTVSQYTFKPGNGVKLNQITARANDLALALASKSLRIEAPIPGKNAIGIENPNLKIARVTLKEVISSKTFKIQDSKLAIGLGRDVAGGPFAINLEKMPHILVAGATGSGKSVCINSIISTFLFQNDPEDLRLILVDPKRVELTNFNGIPHLLTPVITDVNQTVSALKWGIYEMERRYKLFAEEGKRNIAAYNENPGPEGKIPYIVIIIDELADLMSQAMNEVEGAIVRLAQMARATGIHLIVATQRPSVDVLTGLIKANIPARIAFAVAAQADSRTILDMSGAEKLLGNGDMLFIGNGLNKPKRIQGCYVSDAEIEKLVESVKQNGEANYDDSVLQFKGVKGSSGGRSVGDGSSEDDMYDDAMKVIVESGKASASLLQRRLKIGYARAARLLDILEENGAIGPADGAKPRDVLMTDTGSEVFQTPPSDFDYQDIDDNNDNSPQNY